MSAGNLDILRRTVEALEKSFRRYPENEKILHQLATVYMQLGRFDPRAVAVYQKAAAAFPQDVKIQRGLSVSYLITQSSEFTRDLKSFGDLDQESFRRNLDRLQKLVQQFPESPHIHSSLADFLLVGGAERDAVHHYRCAMALGFTELRQVCAHFESVRRLREVSGMVAVFFADLYQRVGANEKADKLFQSMLETPRVERLVLEKYSDFLQRRIEETDPRNERILARQLRKLIRVSLLRGNTSEALTWASQLAAEQLAEDPRLAKDLARRLMLMEDFRQAFEYLSKVPLDGEVKSLLNEMAMLLEKRGELDTAVFILQFINENDELSREPRRARKASVAEPEDVDEEMSSGDISIEAETELQMAELHWKNRRWGNALGCYLRVLELGYEEYRALLEPIDLLIQRVPEVTLPQFIFLTNFFADKRDWRRVLDHATRALQMDPNNPEMSQRVLQACDRLLTEFPADMDVRLAHGDEHLRIGNIERAIQEYRRAAERPEYSMKATRRLALAHFRGGDLQSALQHYQNLPLLEAEDLEKLYDLAIAFANAEQFKDAFETSKLIRDYDSQFRDIDRKYAEYEEKMNENAMGFVVDPKMRDLIGDHSIGRYKYIGKVGSGGMGVVHKVLDLKTNQIVAMKILREGLSSSGKAIDRFFREARIAATLHHQNIVNILDYNISNHFGQSYIAMEFVDGPSLRDVIEKKFAETVEIERDDVLQALFWSRQLCDALDATHKKGIIHRDIKPDNIMIAPGDVVKITDFGIVHVEEATFTPTGALIGTPRYMSPEQVHGGRIDSRSDIYAVGIILYELLIGSPPFISGDISYQQVKVIPTAPREICPAIPERVNRIIMKCLEKAPGDRYQSATELKQDVDEAFVRLGGNANALKEKDDEAAADDLDDPLVPEEMLRPNPLTPPWLVPVKTDSRPAKAPSTATQTPDNGSDNAGEDDTLGDVEEQKPHSRPVHAYHSQRRDTVDLESDFDLESQSQDELGTDFDL